MKQEMSGLEKHGYDLDHAEALGIQRQLTAADPRATAQNIIDLNRFYDCCEDGEGYDVPSERMRQLKRLGLVEGGRGGWYKTNEAGNRLRQAYYSVGEPAP